MYYTTCGLFALDGSPQRVLETVSDRMEFLGPSYVYRVDSADRISWLSEEWLEFAAANGAPELTKQSVEGRPIWEFIGGEEIRHLYYLIFSKVRTSGHTLVVPFRCDSPKLRRFMELSLMRNEFGGIELAGRLLRIESRPAVPLLDAARKASRAEPLQICAWCKRIQVRKYLWRDVEDAIRELGLFESVDLPALKQGVCPACKESLLQQLRDD